MQGKTALMAGAAIFSFVMMAPAGLAASDATTGTTTSAEGTSNAELLERIEALEAEVQSAEQRSAADHDTVSAWKPASGWWDNTSLSGRMYYDITNINQQTNKVESTNNGTSFDIKRFYLGVDHKFDDTFSANLTMDMNYVSADSETQFYVKKAYLQAKLDDAFIVRVGSADMPWIPFAEDVYGYRYVENTLSDRTKFGTSADWGVHMLGKFYDGMFAYQLSVVSGAGYKKAARTENPDIEGRVSFNYDGFTAAIGGYEGHLGDTHSSTNAAPRKAANRFNALASYKIEGLKVGVEYFTANNYVYASGRSSSANTTHGYGVSPFVSYQIDPQWSVFGRYDYVKPFSGTAAVKKFKNDYFNVGVSYSPAKIVDLSLVYKYDDGKNGFMSDSNGTIGGASFANNQFGRYSEIGLWGQLRW